MAKREKSNKLKKNIQTEKHPHTQGTKEFGAKSDWETKSSHVPGKPC